MVRIATQTKNATVPARESPKASFSIPDMTGAYRSSGAKPPKTL
jgi:hypothetical protein